MGKSLYISEKPSVAQEFAKALKTSFKKQDGYMEGEDSIVTWCVGHLVTMSYPEVYDPSLKRWTLETLPFLPKEFRYEIIPNVKKQFNTVSYLLNRKDVDRIYVCTDSGREGEYIYRLVDQLARVPKEKEKRRVWIDSQTEEEILRGIRDAKLLSAYDSLSDAAYLRAKEDYLMGINFSRVLTLKYGDTVNRFLKGEKRQAISVGRVMTCVLGMVVRREREIRDFVKTPFYRVLITLSASGKTLDGEFRAVEGSLYYQSPKLYKENGFRELIDAENMLSTVMGLPLFYKTISENNKNSYQLQGITGHSVDIADGVGCMADGEGDLTAEVVALEKKKENKYPPLLFNLAELQNECSKILKISPDETLKYTQELYEKKLVTYPRTDARVLSSAVAKEIHKNIAGLKGLGQFKEFAEEILENRSYQGIAKTRYVNDKQITDHYAIIPTGQGFGALSTLSMTAKRVYVSIVKRFLSIFYPAAVYQKLSLTTKIKTECFFSSFKVLLEEGYLKIAGYQGQKPSSVAKEEAAKQGIQETIEQGKEETVNQGVHEITEKPTQEAPEQNTEDFTENGSYGMDFIEAMKGLKKGMKLPVTAGCIKEGETAPPKRYNSGSLILTMENAGQFIEDEELRAQMKGSGIGTSATRAEILNKLVKIEYLVLNKKTQMVTPALLGEMIFDVVNSSIKSLLNAELTASWEKGLTYVAEGEITKEEYLHKLEGFVARMTEGVKKLRNEGQLIEYFQTVKAQKK